MFIFALSLLSWWVAVSQTLPLLYSSTTIDSPVHHGGRPSTDIITRQSSISGPVIASDFPDPAIIPFGGEYYAFSTSSGGLYVPLAETATDQRWVVDRTDALPTPGTWTTGNDFWAPDVVQLDNDMFVMYYTARPTSNPDVHCIGTATSKTVKGPYEAAEKPFACPVGPGGAIDPSGYKDLATGLRYVVYKVDGNNRGNGGECGNTIEPILSTPIQLQQVGSDGVSPIGEPVTILDRDASDGPLVEAPSLYRSVEGIYFLFFSSNCFDSSKYDIKYATATNILGPYVKASTPLVRSGDGPNLNGPGGADISDNGTLLAFHANLNPPGEPLKRAMFIARPKFSGTTVTI